jgi:hypothetical protein
MPDHDEIRADRARYSWNLDDGIAESQRSSRVHSVLLQLLHALIK